MPIRRTLLHPETLQSFFLAAEERYFDAAELRARGRTTAAVYLVGYTAEMLLKHAAFRLRGIRTDAFLGQHMGPALTWAKRYLPNIDRENKHSVWFWAHFIRKFRRQSGRPLALDFDAAFLRRVRRVHSHWTVNLRYCERHAEILDAKEALEDVAWIREHHQSLWR